MINYFIVKDINEVQSLFSSQGYIIPYYLWLHRVEIQILLFF